MSNSNCQSTFDSSRNQLKSEKMNEIDTENQIENEKSYLPFDPYGNSRYSKYEEEVLIDPFLRPPICMIIISAVFLAAGITVFVLVGQVRSLL